MDNKPKKIDVGIGLKLTERGKEIRDSLANDINIKSFKAGDMVLFYSYIRSVEEMEKAYKILETEDMVMEFESGAKQISPYYNVIAKCENTIMRVSKILKLDLTSRGGKASDDDKDPLDDIL